MTVTCQCQTLSAELLDSYLGQAIDSICPHGYTDSALNHCAHFVCHVMNVGVGSVSCRGLAGRPAAGRMGVCVRVHELFAACPEVGELVSCGPDSFGDGRFVFVTARSVVNVAAHRMSNVPRKHVGIGIGNTIWHYSNTRDQVVKTTPDRFIYHYSGQTNGLYWGTMPGRSTPTRHGCGL